MVVTTVEEKNRDCPKLQLGPPLTFRDADTPRLLARITSSSRLSKSSSVTEKTQYCRKRDLEVGIGNRL